MNLDSLWMGIAFGLGYLMRRIGLPPMLGFLLAGFLLHSIHAEHGQLLDGIADIGVILLLYTIGLKLKLKTLVQKAILGGSLMSTTIAVSITVLLIGVLTFTPLPYFTGLSFKQILIISFALSFSSTVFAIKILEERGNLNTAEGNAAIGILIIQDILAVLFLTLSKGESPSEYAFLLLLTPLLRPVLLYILKRTGHGEMLTLFGFFMAILGSELFGIVGLKPDLGALVFGMIISNHEKSDELAKNLLNFKDFFLIAFFLSIGFSGTPNFNTLVAAVIISVIVIAKPFIYHFSLSKFEFPVHSSYFASISLTNFSEFALIVGVLSVKKEWIPNDWLIIIALGISISFIISSLLNSRAHVIFKNWKKLINSFAKVHYEDVKIHFDDAQILIIGMGTVGANIYDKIEDSFNKKIVGLDSDENRIKQHEKRNRKVVLHDATNIDFWDKISPQELKIVVLALPDFENNIFAIKRLNTLNRPIEIFATARYNDQIEMLHEAGAHHVFNLYEEVGKGLADEIIERSPYLLHPDEPKNNPMNA
ncbi:MULTISPECIES: cation:proton antiporter domain-containing protein [unclassified Saccharicrinis]|uniref:cation:proton antiporter domain-containing protein n=1 Tax=unclassified Saccharicrinis TaxID=2646859 RepID=UPI003D355159